MNSYSNNNKFVDHYAALGVNQSAEKDEIRAVYKKLALQYHPDKVGDSPEGHARFLEVQAAWDALRHADTRKEYDADFKYNYETEKFYEEHKFPSFTTADRPGMVSRPASMYKEAESSRGGRKCRQSGCPGHFGDEEIWSYERVKNSLERFSELLKEMLNNVEEVQQKMSQRDYTRKDNVAQALFVRVYQQLEVAIENVDRWHSTATRGDIDYREWGFSCKHFELVRRLERLDEDIASMHEWFRKISETADLCTKTKRTAKKENVQINMEVQLAMWPVPTWNIGFVESEW